MQVGLSLIIKFLRLYRGGGHRFMESADAGSQQRGTIQDFTRYVTNAAERMIVVRLTHGHDRLHQENTNHHQFGEQHEPPSLKQGTHADTTAIWTRSIPFHR